MSKAAVYFALFSFFERIKMGRLFSFLASFVLGWKPVTYKGEISSISGFNFLSSRRHLYSGGVTSRFKFLLKQYGVLDISIPEGASIVDVGANIGEFSMAVSELMQSNCTFHAFEPGSVEFKILLSNVNSNKNIFPYNVGLYNSESTIDFFVNSAAADNSVFEFDEYSSVVSIDVVRADHTLPNSPIFLLKVEAEGAEPEVIEGFGSLVEDISYIVVDAGFERYGTDSTLPEVVRLLSKTHQLTKVTQGRMCCLFVNKKIF